MPKLTTTKVQSQAKFRPFLTIFTLMFATVSIFSSFNLVNVQAGNGGNLNLKIKSKTSTDGVNFVNETVSNSDQWDSYNCSDRTFLGNNKINGVSDWEDGLMKKLTGWVGIPNRDCGAYTEKANGQNVFAYQYSYEYKFPSDKRSSESNRYRVHTNQSGDYDGVQYTYTFYNYWNLQKNDWNGWENPNTSNEFKGWLAYAVGGNTQNNTPSLSTGLPSLGDGSVSSYSQSQMKKVSFVITGKEGEARVILKRVNSNDELYQTIAKGNVDFFSRFKIGDTVEVSYRSDQDYQGSYKQIKIIGEIDGITKVEKVGNSSSGFSSWAQNSSAPFSQSYSTSSLNQTSAATQKMGYSGRIGGEDYGDRNIKASLFFGDGIINGTLYKGNSSSNLDGYIAEYDNNKKGIVLGEYKNGKAVGDFSPNYDKDMIKKEDYINNKIAYIRGVYTDLQTGKKQDFFLMADFVGAGGQPLTQNVKDYNDKLVVINVRDDGKIELSNCLTFKTATCYGKGSRDIFVIEVEKIKSTQPDFNISSIKVGDIYLVNGKIQSLQADSGEISFYVFSYVSALGKVVQ